MRKLFLLLSASSILFLTNCTGSKKDETNSSSPAGMKELQIKLNGNSLSLMVPDSTSGKPEVVEQSWGATEIKVGKSFQISISEGQGDIALIKSDVASNDVNKFKRYLNDEPTLLFWESQITEPEFHFYAVQKVGTVSYYIEDIKGDIFKEKEAQVMVTAAKSLKAGEAPKPNS